MRKATVGNGIGMITEIRRETPVFPETRRGRRLVGPFVVFLAITLCNVWISGRYYRIGYAVSSALDEKRNLQKEKDLLKMEISSLRSPSRIEAIAKAELGMVEPRTEKMIRVR